MLIPLGLTAVALAADARIHKKILGYGSCLSSSALRNHHSPTTLIKWWNGRYYWNSKISWGFWFIIKRSYWNSPKGIKRTKGGFLSMLLSTLGASLLGNILAVKWINRAGEGAIATSSFI